MKVKDKLEIELNSSILRNMDIDATDLDGEKVMMNLEKGEYFMLNEVGSRIWDIINKEIKVKEIIESLNAEYDVEYSKCEESVINFLGRLRDAGLININ